MTGRESPFEQKRPKIYSRQKVAAAWFSFQQFISVLIILVATAAVYGVIAGGQWHSALDGATYAAVIGAPLVFIETYGIWLPGFATIRRWPFLASATLKSALYVAWILAGATLSNRLHHMHHAELGRVVLHRDVLAAVVLASIVVNLLLAMSRLLGAGTLRSIIIGRYHRPRREERAFVFVDIRDSVSVEDRIGDVRFYSYVVEIFHAVEQAAMETGGEVLDYIGDQVMLSWPTGQSGAGPFNFVLALADHLGRIQSELRSRYGADAAVRVGIHAGLIVAGEIGVFRRKIVLLGSAVNVAARVEQIARDLHADCIATGAALERFELPKALSATSLGVKQLRGKADAVELWQIKAAERTI